MNKYFLFVVGLVFCLTIIPFISAQTIITTEADKGENSYYVSNYSTREISFTTNYVLGRNQEGKVVYTYEVYPSSKGLDIQLSTTDLIFINDLSSKEIIYISSKELNEIKTVKLEVKIFDKYNNLLNSDLKYFKLIPNNSNVYYEYTNNHSPPRYIGYNISRTLAVINGVTDSDLISITTKTEDNHAMSLNCLPNDEAIIITQDYNGANQINLNISILKKEKLETGDYFIDCEIFDTYNEEKLPQIKLKYTATTLENQNTEDANVSITAAKNKSTALLVLPKFSNTVYVLLIIAVILFLLILFSKD